MYGAINNKKITKTFLNRHLRPQYMANLKQQQHH